MSPDAQTPSAVPPRPPPAENGPVKGWLIASSARCGLNKVCAPVGGTSGVNPTATEALPVVGLTGSGYGTMAAWLPRTAVAVRDRLACFSTATYPPLPTCISHNSPSCTPIHCVVVNPPTRRLTYVLITFTYLCREYSAASHYPSPFTLHLSPKPEVLSCI